MTPSDKPKSTAEKQKQTELAKIHIAQTRLGLDDDTYRAMLKQVIEKDLKGFLTAEGLIKRSEGKISAKYLSAAGRASVLEHLKKAGFNGGKTFNGRPHNIDSQASRANKLKKIEAQLAEAGRPWAYAEAMAERMYKKERLEFCSHNELSGIIAGLTKNAEREGRKRR